MTSDAALRKRREEADREEAPEVFYVYPDSNTVTDVEPGTNRHPTAPASVSVDKAGAREELTAPVDPPDTYLVKGPDGPESVWKTVAIAAGVIVVAAVIVLAIVF